MSCSVGGIWLLGHHQYWTLTKVPLRYPAVASSHGDPAAIVPQNQFLHTLPQVIDGIDIRVVQLKTLDVSLGCS